MRTIGGKCGRIIQVAKKTLDISDIRYAKIKVRGPQFGLVSETLELPYGARTIVVRLFNLEESPKGSIFRDPPTP